MDLVGKQGDYATKDLRGDMNYLRDFRTPDFDNITRLVAGKMV